MFRAVILGAPASGKGTISSRIVKTFELAYLSSGDLLRNQIRKKTKIGVNAKNFVDGGMLMPDDLMIPLIMTELDLLKSKNWLLDGFPRTKIQADALLKEHSLQIAIALDVPIEVIVDRVKGRWIHVASGRVYNDTFNKPNIPGKDDVTGEALEQRPDDAPEAVRKRLELYTATVQPLIEFYKHRGILQTFTGNTSDEIWPNVRNTLSMFLPQKSALT